MPCPPHNTLVINNTLTPLRVDVYRLFGMSSIRLMNSIFHWTHLILAYLLKVGLPLDQAEICGRESLPHAVMADGREATVHNDHLEFRFVGDHSCHHPARDVRFLADVEQILLVVWAFQSSRQIELKRNKFENPFVSFNLWAKNTLRFDSFKLFCSFCKERERLYPFFIIRDFLSIHQTIS